jgi:hypothetical protein
LSTPFFNAHHAPVGAFATFTLGCRGASGGLGLELGAPANQSVYIGLESASDERVMELLPFYAGGRDAAASERERYEGGSAASSAAQAGHAMPTAGRPWNLVPFAASAISREFHAATDIWRAGDITCRILSPFGPVPDPETADIDAQRRALVPAVLVEITIDNRANTRPRRACFGYTGNDPYSAMRRLDDTAEGRLVGVGQGRSTAIVARDPGVSSALGFSLAEVLNAGDPDTNHAFGLGSCAVLLLDTPAGEQRTFRIGVCFYRGGIVTSGIDASYWYTRLFANIEDVGAYALDWFDDLAADAGRADALADDEGLSADQRFHLAHALRSYYGSTQFLDRSGQPLWVVNEGEYRMMNTFDLTVDQLFYELHMNPWTVKNVLDLFTERYSYRDNVQFPASPDLHPGGITFTHDMGVANVFSRPEYSCYELAGLTGCFSYMSHEQLVNWVLCAAVYVDHTSDIAWREANRHLLIDCLDSMIHRDHPDAEQRNGVMSGDSSRTRGGAEITTYDSLDASLGQARGNLYLAGKTWAAYVALERLLREEGRPDLATVASDQAGRCAATIVAHAGEDGTLPAVLGEGVEARIIPAIEGLIFPLYTGCAEALNEQGRFGPYLAALRRHLVGVLREGVCLFPDGGWKLSSTSDNSWLSKIYLCQHIARRVLGLAWDDAGRRADAVHREWLLAPANVYWAWSDQMSAGVAVGSRYYPRGVTAILWLEE